MITYPFSSKPKKNDFPGSGNNRQGYTFKFHNRNIIEYDVTYLIENFPELKDKSHLEVSQFLHRINQIIVGVEINQSVKQNGKTSQIRIQNLQRQSKNICRWICNVLLQSN